MEKEKVKALIVIDMQNDFVNGCLGTDEARAIVPKIKEKLIEYYRKGYEIIFTKDTHNDNYLNTNEGKHLPVPHCIEGSKGWNIVDELDFHTCSFVYKESFGYYGWYGRDFGEVEIVGVCTDICVISNAIILKTLYPEAEVTIDSSCCAGSTAEMHRMALEVMKSCQINIK